MAHFAEINENNCVVRIIVVNNNELLDSNNEECEKIGIEFCKNLFGGRWIQTSYNGKIRGKYAGIGDSYNEEEDIFINPQPYASWTRQGSYWIPPKPYPDRSKFFQWDEEILDWVEIG